MLPAEISVCDSGCDFSTIDLALDAVAAAGASGQVIRVYDSIDTVLDPRGLELCLKLGHGRILISQLICEGASALAGAVEHIHF